MRLIITILLSLLLRGTLDAQILAGPYAPPVGQNGTTAIHKDSSIIVDWASNALIERGWQDITDTSLGKTSAGNDTSATGKSGINGVVSLGDGGIATITFNGKIIDGPGADFAVFENSFDGLFLELAFVEVSSDGVNFFRFDAVSLTDTNVQVASFGNLDATNLYNFAGKYKAQYGTPFDLNELTGISGLNVNNITHVRIIDVVGNLNEPFTTFDSQSNPINEPWPTPFAVGGFDLDAVGIINFASVGIDELSDNFVTHLYPNPIQDVLTIQLKATAHYNYNIIDVSGKSILSGSFNQNNYQFKLSDLKAGIYFLQLQSEKAAVVQKIIKE